MKTKTLDAIALGIVGGVVAAIVSVVAWSVWTTPGGLLLLGIAVLFIVVFLTFAWALNRVADWDTHRRRYR